MGRKSLLTKYVKATLVRLRLEQAIHTLQTGVCIAVLLALLIVAASRLFVLPYYGRIAWLVAVLVVVATLAFILYKRLRTGDAIYRLDCYMPDNLLITALDDKIGETHLASALIEAAESKVELAFEGFKKREKHYVHVKMLAGIAVASSCLAVLLIFPSEAQLEAGAVEKEKEVIEEVKKEVKELVKKEPLPEVKKELQDLMEKLVAAELSEDVLKELVKKQKELRLKEQRLADKKQAAGKSENPADALTDAEQQELEGLGKLADQLAQNVGKAHSALNKVGKAPTLPALAGASGIPSGTDGKPGATSGEGTGEVTGEGDDESLEENEGQTSEGEKGEGEGQGKGSGQGSGAGQGQGAGSGQGQGTGSGQSGSGHGQGNGMGQGPGTGTGQGSGVGKGSGGRNLLSVPHNRVGEKGESSVVEGNLGQGDFIEEHDVQGPVQKGTIHPYQEVVGDYKDSYLKSTEKMQLPSDLQHILSDYFSSIE